MASIHDRRLHLEMLKGILGEDLWLKKNGDPRQKMNDQHVAALISDGNHVLADAAMDSLLRLMPISLRAGDPRWVDYALVGPESTSTGYRKEYPDFLAHHEKEWMRRASRLSRATLLNHLFMVKSVLPCYKQQDQFDSLLIDIDVQIDGLRQNLYGLPSQDRIDLMAPLAESCADLGLSPLFMLSGGRGFWVQIFWDEPVSREAAEALFTHICRETGFSPPVQGDAHWRFDIGSVSYCVDGGNLAHQVCRMPWSMKESEDLSNTNVSVHVDAATGEPRMDFLFDLPESAVEPSLFVPEHTPLSVSAGVDAGVMSNPQELPQTELVWSVVSSPPPPPPPASCGVGIDGKAIYEPTAPPCDFCLIQRNQETRISSPSPPPTASCGVGNESKGEEHLDWDWRDIIAEADGKGSIETSEGWRGLIAKDVPQGSRWNVLANGNIALVSARMKHELGYVQWTELKAAYWDAYPVQNTNGGTTDDWIEAWCRRTNFGDRIVPCSPGITPEIVERCRVHAEEIVSRISGRGRRPDVDELFHVLLVLCHLAVRRHARFEASEDFLARKSGLNPYRTWEAQAEVEGGRISQERDESQHVRHNPTSVNARKKLMRLMGHLCDLTPGEWTGRFPFRRTEIGSNDRENPRVAAAGRAVGSEFERTPGHPFWLDAGAAISAEVEAVA